MAARILVALFVFAACTEQNAELGELPARVAALESQLKQAQTDIEALMGDVAGARALNKMLQEVGETALAGAPAPDPAMDLLDEPAETTTEFTVARSLLTDLAKQGRFMPTLKEDKFVGVKVYGIRADSPLKAIGLKNGDLLRRIDGTPIDPAASIPVLLQALPQRDRFSLEIERKTQPLTLTITVN